MEALAYHMRCGLSLHQGAMQAMQIVAWTSLRDAPRFASVLPTSPAQPVVSPGCGRSTSSRGSVGGGDDIGPPRCPLRHDLLLALSALAHLDLKSGCDCVSGLESLKLVNVLSCIH